MKRRDFLRASSVLAATSCFSMLDGSAFADSADKSQNATHRGSYANSYRVFKETGRGRVAFLGGSITEMDGYRPMVCEYLKKRFPKTEFEFVAAGISSTCSDVGAFRLESDVLSGGKVDLFFVEFAVNDDQDGGFDLTHATRGMEGIIRHIRRSNPNVDIVMTFFVNENLMAQYRNGKEATSIEAHRKVAERYDISTINLAKEIQERIDSGDITWQEFGGVHPAPRGNRICADLIATILDRDYLNGAVAETKPHNLPAPIDAFSYSNASWRGFDAIATNEGATIADENALERGAFRLYEPNWPQIRGSFRQTFAGVPLLCGEKAGAELKFEFDGNALALFILAGPDAGMIDYRIDKGDWRRANAFHHYSGGLHYPRALTLADALENGRHNVELRLASDKDGRSSGTALRILQIAVNRGEE